MTSFPKIALVIAAGVLASGSAIGQDNAANTNTLFRISAVHSIPSAAAQPSGPHSDRTGRPSARNHEPAAGGANGQNAIFFHHACITIP